MTKFEPTKISFIKQIWEEEGFRLKKNLSQNFLIDKNIVLKIIKSADVKEGDTILEIGPGSGAITQSMLDTGATVYACEIDNSAADLLSKYMGSNPNFHLIRKDILDLDLSFLPEGTKVISNLPYHITSPILGLLSNNADKLQSVTIMVQKEMADRITAKAPSRNRSSFSVFTSYYFEKKYLFTVKPGCFTPRPKIDSAILSLIPRSSLPNIDHEAFIRFVKLCFSQKRKQMTTLVKHKDFVTSLQSLGIDINARAEQISTKQFIELYKLLYPSI